MKECEISLLGGSVEGCNAKQDTECAILSNDGILDCSVAAVRNGFQDYSIEELKKHKKEHSPGGRWAGRCLASPNIVQAIDSLLEERIKKTDSSGSGR